MDEEDRAAILRRRALLVASALAGMAAVGCHEDDVAPLTRTSSSAKQSAEAVPSVPQPCLTSVVTAPPPPSVETSATAVPPSPPPTPCLAQRPPVPRPCLSPVKP